MSRLQFVKYQALGNGYLVVERVDWGDQLSWNSLRRRSATRIA